MNGGFIAQGLLFGLATVLLSRIVGDRLRRFTAVTGVVTAVGYVLIATFHGSLQAQLDGTLPLHFLGATLAIFGANILALVLGLHWRKATGTRALGVLSIITGSFGLVAVLALFATFNADVPSGAIERGSVYPIVLWQFIVAIALLRNVKSAATGTTAAAEYV